MTIDYPKLITPALGWKELHALARIHQIPRSRRIKGGKVVRRTKSEISKDIRRCWGRTFPDRMERSKQVLASLL